MHADPETDVLILLNDVARHMRTHADKMAREHGLTRAQWIILVRLERQPDLSQNELAALAEVAPITIARLVDRLEALGLIKRCTDAEDRRIWRLRLTPAATPVLRDVKRCRKRLYGIMTNGIDGAGMRSLQRGLRKMKDNISSTRRLAAA
jgi:MarR family transcriptional regulator, transcriptional regulator for hemolysin